MNFDTVKQLLKSQNQPEYRLTQITEQVKQGTVSWSACSTWPLDLRTQYSKQLRFTSWTRSSVSHSADGTIKALLTLIDNSKIETVLMQPKTGHWSVCLSCEVGCPMNCAFCATGKMGFVRKLTAEEITDQILFWLNYISLQKLNIDIKSVVFMGMGEPFHNPENVFTAIAWLNTYYGFGSRHISVSTSGIPDGVVRLGELFPQVNLAISLHAATNAKRSSLMPINKQYSLIKLHIAINKYLSLSKRQIMFEYLLIDGVNDTSTDRSELITFVSHFPKHLVHINLIRYNLTTSEFKSTPTDTVSKWKKELLKHKISASIRKNLGTDIHGACGQLASNSK